MEIHSILVPIDFSDCSMRALDWAVSLASPSKPRITLLHCISTESSATSTAVDMISAVLHDVTGTPGFLPSATVTTPEQRRATEAVLERVREVHIPSSLESRSIVRDGHPWNLIVDEAKAGAHDLIVMGTRGRSGIDRTVMGSVADRVVRHAAAAVLIVR